MRNGRRVPRATHGGKSLRHCAKASCGLAKPRCYGWDIHADAEPPCSMPILGRSSGDRELNGRHVTDLLTWIW